MTRRDMTWLDPWRDHMTSFMTWHETWCEHSRRKIHRPWLTTHDTSPMIHDTWPITRRDATRHIHHTTRHSHTTNTCKHTPSETITTQLTGEPTLVKATGTCNLGSIRRSLSQWDHQAVIDFLRQSDVTSRAMSFDAAGVKLGASPEVRCVRKYVARSSPVCPDLSPSNGHTPPVPRLALTSRSVSDHACPCLCVCFERALSSGLLVPLRFHLQGLPSVTSDEAVLFASFAPAEFFCSTLRFDRPSRSSLRTVTDNESLATTVRRAACSVLRDSCNLPLSSTVFACAVLQRSTLEQNRRQFVFKTSHSLVPTLKMLGSRVSELNAHMDSTWCSFHTSSIFLISSSTLMSPIATARTLELIH